MVDSEVLARRAAAVRDAVERIQATLPPTADDFLADRTAREVVVLNLLGAIQDAIDLASHWLSDEGWQVPGSYREVFLALADQGVIERSLAEQLAAAAGLRNLIVHRYGALDWRLVFDAAQLGTGALDGLCTALARRAMGAPGAR